MSRRDVAGLERHRTGGLPASDRFFGDELRLPEPVGRYFRAAIAPGTLLAAAAKLRMVGRLKLSPSAAGATPARTGTVGLHPIGMEATTTAATLLRADDPRGRQGRLVPRHLPLERGRVLPLAHHPPPTHLGV